MPPTATLDPVSNPFVELVEALANRHGEVDVHLEHLTLRVPMIREPIELSGTVTVSVKFRELSDRERQAAISRELKVHSR